MLDANALIKAEVSYIQGDTPKFHIMMLDMDSYEKFVACANGELSPKELILPQFVEIDPSIIEYAIHALNDSVCNACMEHKDCTLPNRWLYVATNGYFNYICRNIMNEPDVAPVWLDCTLPDEDKVCSIQVDRLAGFSVEGRGTFAGDMFEMVRQHYFNMMLKGDVKITEGDLRPYSDVALMMAAANYILSTQRVRKNFTSESFKDIPITDEGLAKDIRHLVFDYES